MSAWVDDRELVVDYRIAPGYYMYRGRFDFQVEASDAPAPAEEPAVEEAPAEE